MARDPSIYRPGVKAMVRGAVRRVCRLYPFFIGGPRLASRSLLASLSREEAVVRTRLRDGSSMLVLLNDLVGSSIYFFGDYDPKISWICRRVLRPGDTVLDIGANQGVVSLVCANRVGAAGQVHAFEPQPALAEMLRRSAALNGFRHLYVHETALSREDGMMTLHLTPGNSGRASLGAFEGTQRVQIGVANTSRYLAGLKLAPVRLMKIDVEGHEMAVFEGGAEFFSGNRPAVIVFETNHSDDEDSRLVNHLVQHGYSVFGIPRVLLRMRVEPVESGGVSAWDCVAVDQRCDDCQSILRNLRAPASITG